MGKRSVPKRRHNNTGTVSANRAIGRYTVIWHDSLVCFNACRSPTC